MKVGDQLFKVNIGHNVSKFRPQKLTPVKVVKVGRKYLTIRDVDDNSGRSDIKFYSDTLRLVSDYAPSWKIYHSEQDWLDEKEYFRLKEFLREKFSMSYGNNHLPLATLQQIEQLILNAKQE